MQPQDLANNEPTPKPGYYPPQPPAQPYYQQPGPPMPYQNNYPQQYRPPYIAQYPQAPAQAVAQKPDIIVTLLAILAGAAIIVSLFLPWLTVTNGPFGLSMSMDGWGNIGALSIKKFDATDSIIICAGGALIIFLALAAYLKPTPVFWVGLLLVSLVVVGLAGYHFLDFKSRLNEDVQLGAGLPIAIAAGVIAFATSFGMRKK